MRSRLLTMFGLACLLCAVAAQPASAQSSCDTEPWLLPCAPIQISADGVDTLKLIAAKIDLINGLKTIPEASSLIAFLKLVGQIVKVDGVASYAVPLQFLEAYFKVADKIRPRLIQVGWAAIRHDVELQYVSLQTRNQDQTAEGRMFKRLLGTIPTP
jgi:hypothetical protein